MRQSTLLQLQASQTCLFLSVQLDVSQSPSNRVATRPWPSAYGEGHGKKCPKTFGTQIVTKLKSNCDKTKKNQMLTKLKNSNCDSINSGSSDSSSSDSSNSNIF